MRKKLRKKLRKIPILLLDEGSSTKITSPIKDKPVRENGAFNYEVSSPLTIGKLEKLAHVINESVNRGTCELKLSYKGEPLKWSEHPILVNDTMFYVLAKRSGV